MSRGEIIYGFAPMCSNSYFGFVATKPPLADDAVANIIRNKTSKSFPQRVVSSDECDGASEFTVKQPIVINKDAFKIDVVDYITELLGRQCDEVVVHEKTFTVDGPAPLFEQYEQQQSVHQ